MQGNILSRFARTQGLGPEKKVKPNAKTKRSQMLNFSTFWRFSGVAFNCRVEKIKSLSKGELGSILLVTECRVEFAKRGVLDSRVSSRKQQLVRSRVFPQERGLNRGARGTASFRPPVVRCSIPYSSYTA
jgi:hypothetical protein